MGAANLEPSQKGHLRGERPSHSQGALSWATSLQGLAAGPALTLFLVCVHITFTSWELANFVSPLL